MTAVGQPAEPKGGGQTIIVRRQVEQKAATRPHLVYSSDLPGRPTSRALIEQEYRRRREQGEAESSLAAEARHLSLWLSRDHPDAPPATPRTVENRLRELRRDKPPK